MIWEISVLIVSMAILILVAFLVPTIVQFRRSAQKIEEVSANLDRHLPGILANMDEIATNLSAILIASRQQVKSLSTAVEQVRGMVDDVVTIEKRIKYQIEKPLVQTLKTVSAANKAMQVFLATVTRSRNNR
ncbi:DUF948 domain-containing protein [Candidatus Saccharibacteria bacterium]|nr:DUF948 domain-containing protein [Candidatus Saccharibacteria bacterium]NIW79085.1 DUF948 domain-containing protein [Calditrichia bacterium]